jgi:ATP/maltotriose-dependent transcriptional regulator MalT
MRSGAPAFTERDRQVAALARPHLNELWHDAERLRRGPLPLSSREWEVLELAAAGRSYSEIAAQLFVSLGTVRKHMEHVRERLGVHSVLAAAAIALPRPAGQELPRRRRDG